MTNKPLSDYILPPDLTDTAALAANRAGELAPAQQGSLRGRLLPRLLGNFIPLAIFLPMLLCFGAGMFGSFVYVGQRGHAALIQGGRYRLFYFPRSKRVVAVEPHQV
jgi:hypothetical protein